MIAVFTCVLLPVVKATGDDELTTKSAETGTCTTTTYCMVVLPMAFMATHVMVYVPRAVYVCVALSTSYTFVPSNNDESPLNDINFNRLAIIRPPDIVVGGLKFHGDSSIFFFGIHLRAR